MSVSIRPTGLPFVKLSHKAENSPKLALNPVVARPEAGSADEIAYDEKAAKEGVSVAAYVAQKAPKVVKTAAGKVLPRTHSRRPPTNIMRPPKK
jgi:hypothetical protein